MKKLIWIICVVLIAHCNSKQQSTVTDSSADSGDSADITISESGGNTQVMEGGTTDSYTIALTTKPTATVSIQVTNSDGQLTLSPNIVSFTKSNWSTPQTITVTAVDDQIAQGQRNAQIQHTILTSDSDYNTLFVRNVVVTVADNDTAGVFLNDLGGVTVSESGQADTYTIVLTAGPMANVTIYVTPADNQLTVSPSSVTFSTTNWSTPKTITVTAVDDAIIQGTRSDTINHIAASSDTDYNSLPTTSNSPVISPMSATILDNDTNVIYVRKSASSGGDGKTWNTAYTELRDALAAAVSGNDIWVAAGTYTPDVSDASKSFVLKNNVNVYGGFIGGETLVSDRQKNSDGTLKHDTILSGDLNGDDVHTFPNLVNYGDNSLHVVKASNSSATLDGFIIEGGHANGTSPDREGAGAYLQNCSMTLSNMTFRFNWADRSSGTVARGGALFIASGQEITIANSSFLTNNSGAAGVANLGGAIYNASDNLTITNSVFQGNTTTATTNDSQGGAVYNTGANLTVTDSQFQGNSANGGDGGAIYNTGTSSTVSNTVFQGNSTTGAGTGGAMYSTGNNMSISNSTFTTNTSIGSGGAILNNSASLTITNSIFTNNTSGNYGGAMYSTGNNLMISTSLFTTNTASDFGGALRTQNADNTGVATVSGSIFKGNSTVTAGGAIATVNDPGELRVLNNRFDGNTAPGDGGAVYHKDSLFFTAVNNLYLNNTAATVGALGGGGVCVYQSHHNPDVTTTNAVLINNTFFANTVGTGNTGGGAHFDKSGAGELNVYQYNSVYFGNMLNGVPNTYSIASTNHYHSDLLAPAPSDPFQNSSVGDLHLSLDENGAIIGTNGLTISSPPTTLPTNVQSLFANLLDFDGNSRAPIGLPVDMGAYEYNANIQFQRTSANEVIAEGSQATFQIKGLNGPFTLTTVDPTQLSISPASVSTGGSVKITAVPDSVVEGFQRNNVTVKDSLGNTATIPIFVTDN